MYVRIKTEMGWGISLSLQQHPVFPSAKKSSLWENPCENTYRSDTTVLSLSRYVLYSSTCQRYWLMLWTPSIYLTFSLCASRARSAYAAALTRLRRTPTLWRNTSWSREGLWRAWGVPSAAKVPWVSRRVYSVHEPDLGVLQIILCVCLRLTLQHQTCGVYQKCFTVILCYWNGLNQDITNLF